MKIIDARSSEQHSIWSHTKTIAAFSISISWAGFLCGDQRFEAQILLLASQIFTLASLIYRRSDTPSALQSHMLTKEDLREGCKNFALVIGLAGAALFGIFFIMALNIAR